MKQWILLPTVLFMAACSPHSESEKRGAEAHQLIELFFEEIGKRQPPSAEKELMDWKEQTEHLLKATLRGDGASARLLSYFFLRIWINGWCAEELRERILLQAYEWMQYAVDKGDTVAMVDFYAVNEFDRYLDERYRKAYMERGLYTILIKDDKTGDEMERLALCYRDGTGIEINRELADYWHRRFLNVNSLPATEEDMERWRKGGAVLLPDRNIGY